MGATHVAEGTEIDSYNSNPPTSGPHWPQAASWGVYDKPLPDERLVHNLEHGGTWISYTDAVDESTISALEDLANDYRQAVILTPRPENDSPIAVASWGRLMKMESFNRGQIETFIRANLNNSPERFARL